MNILITGSTGYLGSSFVNRFNYKYSFLEFSLKKEKLENISFENINVVLHCAALVHQKVNYTYKTYEEINVKYSIDLARKAKSKGVKQFIFISSIAVYGNSNEVLTENTLCNPVSFYGSSKMQAELELLKLNDDSFIVSIIRPPMIYGKGAPGNMKFLVNMIKNIPGLPLNRINNKRTFTYIGNLCNMISQIIETHKDGIFLAGDSESISTTDLIKLIAMELDKKFYLINILPLEFIIKSFRPNLYKKLYQNLEIDNSISMNKLELKNQYKLKEGIKYMIHGEKS